MSGGRYFRGKHSIVFVEGERAIKKFRPGFELNFGKEVYFLKKLQQCNFVPRLYCWDEDKLEIAMEFIEGKLIRDVALEPPVIKKCFNACRTLDTLGIQKEEMHRPDRHIIIRDDTPYFVDFERARETEKPSNVTQFAVYTAKRLGVCLEQIRELLSRYKLTYGERDFVEILRIFGIENSAKNVK